MPPLFRLEVSNVFLTGERRRRSTEADTAAWTEFLSSIPMEIDDGSLVASWSVLLAVARRHNLSVYDACYLELALRQNLPLATLDDKLMGAAAAAGVAVVQP